MGLLIIKTQEVTKAVIDMSWNKIWFSQSRQVPSSSRLKNWRERQIVLILVYYQLSIQEAQKIHISLSLIEVDVAYSCFPLVSIKTYSISFDLSSPHGTLIHRWESPEVQTLSLCFLFHIWLVGWGDMSVLKGPHYFPCKEIFTRS